jgi:KDO2-lipid IV(A) lauroyltransferase
MLVPEIAFAWWGSARRHGPLYEVRGLEHLEAAAARGQGVVLLFCHFTTLELAGRLLAYHHPMAALYREHGNPVLEYMVRNHRMDYGDALFNRTELRGMVRYLRRGGVLWYAPDQDYGRGQSVFVPFFGIPTSTITSPHQLARMGRARVLVTQNRRLPDGRYLIEVQDWLADLPTSDPTHDCARINEAVERLVRECPEQYLWVHRRFKTRPEGESSLYGA